MKHIIIYILFFLISCNLHAKTTASKSSGSWDISSNWTNGIPNSNSDDITISSGDSINNTIASLVIGATAKLTIESNATLVVNDITFNNGSIVYIETGGKLIVLGNLTNKNNSNDISIDGYLTIIGTLSNGTNSDIFGNGNITASSYSGSCCIMGYPPSSLSGGTIIQDSILLPISLFKFEANYDKDKVHLYWLTASEVNNAYFTIEKSDNLTKWIITNKIAGAGNSNQLLEYNCIDDYDYLFDYYRLKQTDYDGKFTYSNTIYVKKENSNDLSILLDVVKLGSDVELIIDGVSGHMSIELINTYGQPYCQKSVDCIDNVHSCVVKCVKPAIPGTYFIVLKINDRTVTKKIIID